MLWIIIPCDLDAQLTHYLFLFVQFVVVLRLGIQVRLRLGLGRGLGQLQCPQRQWTAVSLVCSKVLRVMDHGLSCADLYDTCIPRGAIRSWPLVVRAAAPLVVFFTVGLLVAAIFFATTSYPYFLTGPIHGRNHSGDGVGGR